MSVSTDWQMAACPECGSLPAWHRDGQGRYVVRCTNAPCGTQARGRTLDAAKAAWKRLAEGARDGR